MSYVTRNRYVSKQKARGFTNAQIATDLGLSKRQIQRIVKTAREEHRYGRKKGSGRKEALSGIEKMRISNKISKNPYYSTPNLKRSLDINASKNTIYRCIRRIGRTHKRGVKVLALTETHKENRLRWANLQKRRSWKRVVFTDECTFFLNQLQYGWAPRGQSIPQRSMGYNPKV